MNGCERLSLRATYDDEPTVGKESPAVTTAGERQRAVGDGTSHASQA